MKKITKILSGTLLLLWAGMNGNTAFSQSLGWEWARGAGSTGEDMGNSIAADANGNVYVTGAYTSASISFGLNTFTNSGAEGSDLFLVKYDVSGNVVWAKNIGGTKGDVGYKVTTDISGHVYLAGWYSSPSITFGSTTLTNSASGNDMFIAKYDASGNVLWAKSAAGNGNDVAYGIAVDANSNVYVTGSFASSTISFYATSLTNGNTGSNEIYVVKYDAAGNVLWAKAAGGTGSDIGYAAAVDSHSNLYVTGHFDSPSIVLGSKTITNTVPNVLPDNHDTYIVKYDASGNVLWAAGAGGSGNDMSYGISADDGGNIYLTGWFDGSGISFGSVALTNNGYADTYVVKFNDSGNVTWAKSFGGIYDDIGQSITVDASGDVYVTGKFSSASLNLGSVTLTNKNAGSNDIYIMKYNPSGNVVWSLSAGDMYDDAGNAILVSASKNIYLTGKFNSSSITFGNVTLTKGCGDDFFVAKLGLNVGIQKNMLEGQMDIYPNPSTGIFNLSGNIQDGEITVVNGIGERVFHWQASGLQRQKSIDLSDQPRGIYLIEVKGKEKNYRSRVILK